MAKTGRPTKFTQKIADEICDRIAEGESLYSICADGHMPGRVTVYKWLASSQHKEFVDQYTQARERQAETFIDQCVDIADDNTQDTITLTAKNGKQYEKINYEHINRSRLRVDTRIKLAEKLAPKKYTPKALFEHSGKNGGAIAFESLATEDLLKIIQGSGKKKRNDKQ